VQSTLEPEVLIEMAEAESLSGDIRDALLTHVRTIKVPWAMLAEERTASSWSLKHRALSKISQPLPSMATARRFSFCRSRPCTSANARQRRPTRTSPTYRSTKQLNQHSNQRRHTNGLRF
jgi:hypothetical protein